MSFFPLVKSDFKIGIQAMIISLPDAGICVVSHCSIDYHPLYNGRKIENPLLHVTKPTEATTLIRWNASFAWRPAKWKNNQNCRL